MSLGFLISLGLGGIAVMQGAINRQILDKWGVAPTVLLNNILLLIFGLILYFGVKMAPDIFPENFRLNGEFSKFEWWYLLPGFLGLCMVGGIPVAMSKVGATKVFVAIVVGQIVTSLFWDMYKESIPLTWPRALAAALAVASVVVLNWEG